MAAMQDLSDAELLFDWVSSQREAAFCQIVERYASLVHNAARRVCRDESIAAETTQLVFIVLARKAAGLKGRSSLGGWLHHTAVMEARNLVRRSVRESQKRELLKQHMEPHENPSNVKHWNEVQPFLDEALEALPDKDREVLLLHYFRSFSVQELAQLVGIAPSAARKRIERALEKLRRKLQARGYRDAVTLGAVLAFGFSMDAKAGAPATTALTAKALTATASGSVVFTGEFLTSLTTIMKGSAIVKPAAAAAIVILGLSLQHRAISATEARRESLRTQLVALDSSPKSSTGDSISGKATVRLPGARWKSPASIDWEEAAKMFIAVRNGRGSRLDFQEFVRIPRMLEEDMTVDDLVRALGEISGLKIDDDSRRMLESIVLEPLMKKAPDLALQMYVDRIYENEGTTSFTLSNGFLKWAGDAPDKAEAWLDQQIKEGKFESKALDGRNMPLARFEAALLSKIFHDDPEGAAARISALSETVRSSVFGEFVYRPIDDKDHAAFADLVRKSVSQKESSDLVVMPAALILNKSDDAGYQKVNEYLNRIAASPGERDACVKLAGGVKIVSAATQGLLTERNVQDFLSWASGISPESALSNSGKALGNASNGRGVTTFDDAAKLAVKFHESTGSDDFLCGFLSGWGVSANKEKSRDLAAKITDPAKREDILKKIK